MRSRSRTTGQPFDCGRVRTVDGFDALTTTPGSNAVPGALGLAQGFRRLVPVFGAPLTVEPRLPTPLGFRPRCQRTEASAWACRYRIFEG